jgi:flagellar hook protein FlgE
MSFFGVPLSGLTAAQDALQSVSNNLANLDTVGYKDQTTSFSDIFAQSSAENGVGDPIEQGLGTEASSTTSDFSDGTTTSTGVPSNMALTGNGFFVTESSSGTTSYTRAGDFTLNNAGQLVTTSGDTVMGYGATNGVVDTSGSLQPLTVNLGSSIAATPTTSFALPANLDSASASGTTFSTSTPVYDSLGTQHTLTVDYTKAASPANTWTYSVSMPTADTGASSATIASGTMTFDSSGNLSTATDTAGDTVYPAVSGSSTATGTVAISTSLADGAATLGLSWDLSSTAGAITQNDLTSTQGTATQNGSKAGTLTSYSVSSDGTIEGTYSNGVTNALGQVAVATFANEQGLSQAGTSEFSATAASGAASVGVAGAGGRGTIAGGYTESSNVDVAAEFSKMIVAQEAYQANAKTVTTLNTISQDTVNMLQS